MRIRCYVDGLNFYYGIAKRLKFKWIDLRLLLYKTLCSKFGNDIELERVTVFTARILDQEPAERQDVYLNALKQSKVVVNATGKFKKRIKNYRQYRGDNKEPGSIVPVIVFEEKMTDVNITCAMVSDAYDNIQENNFDMVVLVSNDSDFSGVLNILQRIKQKTGLITPILQEEPYNRSLKKFVDSENIITHIDSKCVRECRLPEKVGNLTPPDYAGWI